MWVSLKKVIKNRRAWFLAGIALIGAGCQPVTTDARAPVRPVPILTLQTVGGEQLRPLIGQVEPSTVSPIAFTVDGRITALKVREGEHVQRGQVLAQLDDEPYRLQLQQAQAEVQQLTAEVARKRKLLAYEIISQAQFERLQTRLNVAQSRQQLARRKVRESQLQAPFDGLVAERRVEPQQVIQAGMPIFLMSHDQRVDVQVGLPAVLAQSLELSPQLTAEGTLLAGKHPPLSLSYREHQTVSLRGESVYQLTLSTARPAGINIYPGMAVRVQLHTGLADKKNHFIVPSSALFSQKDKQFAVWQYQQDSGKVHLLPVQVTSLAAEQAVITAPALTSSMKVVSAGVQHLHEGQQVREWVRE